MFSGTHRVLFIFGTRPEAIKLCPLVKALRAVSSALQVVVCVTGQHREMLGQVLDAFEIVPDYDLGVMTGGQTLNGLSSRLLSSLEVVFEETGPALTVVQGDTTTTLCGALASFHRRVPVAHVEAGMRTWDISSPFPEEANRVLVDRLSTLHFPATRTAADNLLLETYSPLGIMVTGNTGIDALAQICARLERGDLQPQPFPIDGSKRLVLVTAHRRESFGAAFEGICSAVAKLADRDDVQIVWPVHPNPQVKQTVERLLVSNGNVLLCDPLDYVSFVDLMRRCYLILTDSGGIQEEAPWLGKPVLVLREKTERPEGLESGTVKLVGTHPEAIVTEAARLLGDAHAYATMARPSEVYGDGKACARIASRIAAYLLPDTNVPHEDAPVSLTN